MTEGKCRYCGSDLNDVVIDLRMAPLSNDYLNKGQIKSGQYSLPLRVCVCGKCKLVQVSNWEMPSHIFNSGYKYFSSYSTSWLKHSSDYVDMIVKRLHLEPSSHVVEVASNDGYLLQYFKKYSIEPLGIDPSEATAEAAEEMGVHTLVEFFGKSLAERLVKEAQSADLIIGNNVLAHVPDIRDFVSGLKILLKPNGTITMEFPHFLNIIKYNQFDTIYHEHFSYLTMLVVKQIFSDEGLKIYDVEKLPTHGGSLRIYATHDNNDDIQVSESVSALLDEEIKYGLDDIDVYHGFRDRIHSLKFDILSKLIELKKQGKTICGYGAAAKGNTMFNYCGIGTELVDYVVDANPHKQNLFMPGSLIPIYAPDKIRETEPDYVIIVPWNISDEITSSLQYIRDWGGKFIQFIPDVKEW